MGNLGAKFSKAEKREKHDTLAREIRKREPDMALVEKLLADADVKASDSAGNTLLHDACATGHLDIVKMLVERKADVNAVNAERNTPLIYAVFSGRDVIVEYLLAQGAVKSHRNGISRTAADYARDKGMSVSHKL